MKRWRVAVCLLLLFCLLCGVCYAVGDEARGRVLRGSPYIDGKIDALYRASYTVSVSDAPFFTWGEGNLGAIRAQSWLLWDFDFLYICTEVRDDDLVQSYLAPAIDWQTDCVSNWLADGGSTFKVQADPFGRSLTAGDGSVTIRLSDTICASRIDREHGVYVIEMAIPLDHLSVGHEVGYSLQVNDLRSLGNGASYASETVCAENLLILDDDMAQPMTEAPETNPTPTLPEPNVPTGDLVLLAGIAALVAIALLILLLRRPK